MISIATSTNDFETGVPVTGRPLRRSVPASLLTAYTGNKTISDRSLRAVCHAPGSTRMFAACTYRRLCAIIAVTHRGEGGADDVYRNKPRNRITCTSARSAAILLSSLLSPDYRGIRAICSLWFITCVWAHACVYCVSSDAPTAHVLERDFSPRFYYIFGDYATLR